MTQSGGDGVEVGRAHITISPDVLLSAFASQGAKAGRSFFAAFETAANSSGVAAGFDRASQSVRSLANHLGIAAFQMQILGGALTAFVSGPLLAAGVGLAKWGLSTAMNTESAQVALKAMLGPSINVEALFKRLSDMAIKSPIFEIDQLFLFTKTLISAGVGLEQTEKILQSLDKTFTVFGVTGERAQLVLRAIGQVFSKGKVSAEEMNQQIGEQIPLWGLLDDAMGKPKGTTMSMNAAGNFSVEMFGDLLAKLGSVPYIAKGAAEGVNTLSSRLSIAKEALQQLLATEFLKWFPTIKWHLDQLGGAAKDFASLLTYYVSWAVEGFIYLANGIQRLHEAYKKLTPEQQIFVQHLILIAPIIGPAILTLGFFTTGLSMMFGVISSLISPLGLLIALIGGGLFLALKNSSSLTETFSAFASSFVESWRKNMPGALSTLGESFQRLGASVKGLMEALGLPSWEDIGSYLGQRLPEILARLTLAFSHFIDFVSSGIESLRRIWVGLDEDTQKNIISAGKWALAFAPFIPLVGAFSGVLGSAASSAGGLATALGGVISKHPHIGLVLVAVLALGAAFAGAYAVSEDFRKSVQGFVEGVKNGWENHMKPALDGLKRAFSEDLMPAAEDFAKSLGFPDLKSFGQWLGEHLVQALSNVVRFLTLIVELDSAMLRFWGNFVRSAREGWDMITGVGKAIGGFFGDLGRGAEETSSKVGGFFQDIGSGAKEHIGNAIEGATNKAKGVFSGFARAAEEDMDKPIDRAFKSVANTAWEVAGRLGRDIGQDAKGTFTSFGQKAQEGIGWVIDKFYDLTNTLVRLYNDHIRPVFDFFRGIIGDVAHAIHWLTNDVIGKAFSWIGDHIKTVVEWIGRLWDWLTDRLKAPINVAIGFINRGIIAPWKWIAHLTPGIPHIDYIPTLATGGLVSGPGSPTSDSILARLSDGEFVMRASAVDYWGLDAMRAMNSGSSASSAMPSGGSSGPTYVTVKIGDEVIADKIEASIDANNRSMATVLRGRRVPA